MMKSSTYNLDACVSKIILLILCVECAQNFFFFFNNNIALTTADGDYILFVSLFPHYLLE